MWCGTLPPERLQGCAGHGGERLVEAGDGQFGGARVRVGDRGQGGKGESVGEERTADARRSPEGKRKGPD